MSAMRGLLRKEAYHILRDRRTLIVLMLLPIVQVILFGYAIRTDVDHIRLAVIDPRPDHATLQLQQRLEATGVFDIVARPRDRRELERLFQEYRAHQAIVFEPNFAEQLARGLPAQIQLLTDATEPNLGSTAQAYALAIIAMDAKRQGAPGTTGTAATSGPVTIVPEMRMRFNPTRESSNLFVPGLMAMVLTIISALMTAISLTREKETGTMEALLVSPLRPWQIIVGKVTPYLAIGFVSVLAVVVEARVIFHVPLRGSMLLLMMEGLLFILVSLSFGILISARTSSQRVAMMGAMLSTMLPTMLLSGFMFPIESMPLPLQVISHVVPARWFVEIARGIMLKGIGLEFLWKQTLVLMVMAAVLLTLSTRSFKVRLG